jgi:adenylate cyclase
MATEIERKFLVLNEGWRAAVVSEKPIVQGYLATAGRSTVRARIKGDQGFLTVKGRAQGISRAEFEYPIPVEDARAMLDEMAESALVEKVRYEVQQGPHLWELDVFSGANAGLVVAELELASEDESFARPDWLGEEVSEDRRYTNASLARHPYKDW